jgi:hypothetical protein
MSEYAQIAADVATALGIPIAVVAFLVDRRRERKKRDRETYRALADEYSRYLTLLLQNPNASTPETDWIKSNSASPDLQQQLLIQVAINMIQTAHHLYVQCSDRLQKTQWPGWREYLEDWCKVPAFVEMWEADLVDQYDAEFQKEVRKVYDEVHAGQRRAA